MAKKKPCPECGKRYKGEKGVADHLRDAHGAGPGFQAKPAQHFEPDWAHTCDNCGSSPIVPLTGMCGPCTWGEAETAGGNW